MVSRQVQNVSVSVAPDLGETSHGALKGVAVQVRRSRRHDRMTLIAFLH